MSDWRIRVPFESRSDPVGFVGLAARQLEDANERAVVGQMVLDAIDSGYETAGDLADAMERRSPEERRVLVDSWREKVGLETISELERRREQRKIAARFEDFDIPGPPRWEGQWQQCHAPDCRALPVRENGAIMPVSVVRWWCDSHKHLAAEGDLEDWEPAYIGVEFGRLVPSEKERLRVADEIRKRDQPLEEERRAREEHVRREREALERVRERWEEENPFVSIGGLMVRPENVNVSRDEQ